MTGRPSSASRRRLVGYVAGWLLAATTAVSVGVLAVTGVGDSLRDRGPTVNSAVRDAQVADQSEGTLVAPSAAPKTRTEFEEEFGVFVVECQGVVATGVETRPADGWRTISFETGPDDDVDAVFARQGRSIEIEIFCNRGEPIIADLEPNELPDED